MKRISQFWEETPGMLSWIRGAGTVLILLVVFLVVYQTLNSKEVDMGLVALLLTIAYAGKVTQKGFEQPSTNKQNETPIV